MYARHRVGNQICPKSRCVKGIANSAVAVRMRVSGLDTPTGEHMQHTTHTETTPTQTRKQQYRATVERNMIRTVVSKLMERKAVKLN